MSPVAESQEDHELDLDGRVDGASTSPFDPALAERVAALRLTTAHVVDGVATGLHRSAHRGASVVFVEHRDYRPGDDLRLLDWRAYARNDRHVTKRFEQETELAVHLWIDASPSMSYGDGPSEKARTAASLLAAFATIASAQGDPVGVARFDEALRAELPPRSSPSHLRSVLRTLAAPPRDATRTSIARALSDLVERTRRRAVVLCASDLLDFDDTALVPLELAARRGHDVRVFQVLHRDELELPFDGPAHFEGLEGEATVEADPTQLRDAYVRELRAHIDRCRQRLHDAGARHRLVVTDEPLVEVVSSTLHERSAAGTIRAGAGRPRWA